MSKTNSFVKYLKNINNFINSLLEKNLNKLKFDNLKNLTKNNKIVLTIVALFIISLSYLLLPTFYNKTEIIRVLKAQLQNKLNLKFNFSKKIEYNLFPRPHFTTYKTIIFDNKNEISKISKVKIFISLENLFSLKKTKIKNLTFENANFELNNQNYNFFFKLLDQSFKDGKLEVKNSNIFFRNIQNEVLFMNKILKIKYYYDSKELKNIVYAENEIFNIPFSIISFKDSSKTKFFSDINLNLIKLKIKNELNFKDNLKTGKSDIIYNKTKSGLTYEIKKNFFKFDFFNKMEKPKFLYQGKFNFKPFFASIDGKTEKLNLNYLFESNAIVAQLLKTEIFNNKNIDFKLNLNAEKIYNNFNFKNVNIKSKIQDGLIDTDKSKFEWRDFAEFELVQSLIYLKNGELILDGTLNISIIKINEIYKFLLTPKNYRKQIQNIDLNFTYNFDQNIVDLKDIKIDSKMNANVNRILNNVILRKDNLQNKIYLKNLLNEAIKSYFG